MYELGTLRNVPRVWNQMMGPNVANLAEHHFRVIWLSLLIAKHEGVENHEKIMKMALVHDLPESRTGDAHYMSRLYTQRNESGALDDILADTALEEGFKDIWHEYEKRECIESKIVKDADTLDVDLELRELASDTDLEKRWRSIRKQSVYPRLYTETGKKLWTLIAESSPHDWHILGKNRHTFGDWKNPVE